MLYPEKARTVAASSLATLALLGGGLAVKVSAHPELRIEKQKLSETTLSNPNLCQNARSLQADAYCSALGKNQTGNLLLFSGVVGLLFTGGFAARDGLNYREDYGASEAMGL